MRFLVCCIATVAFLGGCERLAPPKPGGVVLVIADGTSNELLAAARAYLHGAQGKFALDDFPQSAFVRTYSGSHLVTDSGAAATAMARGIKADNRVVGMADPNAKSSPPSILDLARKAGWSTAVITDDSVTGGTPAPFLIEHGNRDQHDQIAGKIIPQLGPRADIVLGGGAKWFYDLVKDPAVTYKPGEREKVHETHAALASSGVEAFESWDSFKAYVDKGGGSQPVLGTFFAEEFPYYADGLRTLRLKDMVEQTVRLLKAKGRPFLLIVEAALPDKACHLNNAKRAMVEVGEYDATMDWLRKNLGPNVLLLATTDHNTGGLAFNGYPPLKYRGETLLGQEPLLGHSILTWASGPGSDPKTVNLRTRIVSEPGKPAREVKEEKQPKDFDYAQPALIEAAKGSLHTGGDVWLFAAGAGAEKIHGSMDNTRIYRLMAEAIAPPKP